MIGNLAAMLGIDERTRAEEQAEAKARSEFRMLYPRDATKMTFEEYQGYQREEDAYVANIVAEVINREFA